MFCWCTVPVKTCGVVDLQSSDALQLKQITLLQKMNFKVGLKNRNSIGPMSALILSYIWIYLMLHGLNYSLNFVGVKANHIGYKGLTFFIDLGVIETHHRVTMKQMNLVVVAKRILWSFSNLQIQYGKITVLPGPPSHIVRF